MPGEKGAEGYKMLQEWRTWEEYQGGARMCCMRGGCEEVGIALVGPQCAAKAMDVGWKHVGAWIKFGEQGLPYPTGVWVGWRE